MAIKKQEFYEGAALHMLARSGSVKLLRYQAPFFFINNCRTVLLKYSTKSRSPWGFTFMPDEQAALCKRGVKGTVIGLICGSDGVAALDYTSYLTIAATRSSSLHVACYRKYGQYYELFGPDGTLSRKVSPSAWSRILLDAEDQ